MRRILDQTGDEPLRARFDQCCNAINALKHGYGRSHNVLLEEPNLPFRVKKREENFFFEGDVSEIWTLVEVDDTFVRQCVRNISDLFAVLERLLDA